MQPSNPSGRRLRLALMPVSWLVAFAVIYGVLVIAARVASTDIPSLLRTDTLWPCVLIFPALFFGKVLGLMATNLMAYVIPPLRRTFDSESAQTGRHEFAKAMRGLGIAALITGALTALGTALFLANRH